MFMYKRRLKQFKMANVAQMSQNKYVLGRVFSDNL